jgi:predicted nucleic-acid-binding Zn-ribbon protein
MAELIDYSGKFNSDLKFDDFSKEWLIKYIREISSDYLKISEYWQNEVQKKFGQKQAMEFELACFTRAANEIFPRIARLANIQIPIKDVIEGLKMLQLIPDNVSTGIYKNTYDIKNRDHVVMTVAKCGTLEFFEKKAPERIYSLCQTVDVGITKAYFRALNPDIEVEPLKLPPRKSKDEVPCIWDIKLIRKT